MFVIMATRRRACEAHTVNVAMPQRLDPLPKLRRLAKALGWNHLYRHQHHCRDKPVNGVWIVTWYVNTRRFSGHAYLQISESPVGRKDQYIACVRSTRYRLSSGWHFFRLPHGRAEIEACVEKLSPWIARRHFSTLAGRRAYRVSHPETIGHDTPSVPFDLVAGIMCRNTLEGWLHAARGDHKAMRRARQRFAADRR
jgi:hypothetical protein